MAVMPPGMHLSRHRRFVRHVASLLDRQRIHIGAYSDDSAISLAAANDADHAGASDSGHHLVAAEALELLGDGGGGAVHVVKEFGMGVDVMPPGGDLAVHGGNAVDDRHQVIPRGASGRTLNISRSGPLGQIKPAVAAY